MTFENSAKELPLVLKEWFHFKGISWFETLYIDNLRFTSNEFFFDDDSGLLVNLKNSITFAASKFDRVRSSRG